MEHSDEIAASMQQMLEQSAAAAEAVVAGARTEREVAAAERAAARQALLDTQNNTEKLRAGFFQQQVAHLENDFRKMISRDFALRLLQADVSVGETAALLDQPEGFVADVAQSIGFVHIKPTGSDTKIYVWVTFESQGRGGYLSLRWGSIICRFWYEIAARPAHLLLEIPREEHWEAQTNIPLAQRQQALQFMGERMRSFLVPGSEYRIEVDSVVLF